MIKITTNKPIGEKDVKKAEKADYFIGIGCKGSSTESYQKQTPKELCNKTSYDKAGKVFVSINGKRRNRIGIKKILDLLQHAKNAGCSFIADKEYDRQRDYNIGERELVCWFEENDYFEVGKGEWYPNSQMTSL